MIDRSPSKVLQTLLLAAMSILGCARSGARPNQGATVSLELRQALNTVGARTDRSIGWFLPVAMMDQQINVRMLGPNMQDAFLESIASDNRFAIREFASTAIIVPRRMGAHNGVAASSRLALPAALSQRFPFTTPLETDLTSLHDLLLHDLAQVSSSRNFDFAGSDELWSVRIRDATILDVLQLLCASAEARLDVDGGKVVLVRP